MSRSSKPQRASTKAAPTQGTPRGAFTLLEIVLAVGITSVLMLTVFGILNQAIGTWAATLNESDVSQRASRVLDALAEDLSAFATHQGENTWMEFYKDQATDRFGTYKTSTLYFITSTKDGPEDAEIPEEQLRAIAWGFRRSNFGTATNPQDGFILSRAIIDAENTFAGPLKQAFETTSFETFNETSLRGGFSGLSLPAWKTIDHGGLVDVNKDWLDEPANIFATDILSIKLNFTAFDKATKQRVSIDKDFAVLSGGILLVDGFRDRNNPTRIAALATAQTKLAAAQITRTDAQTDYDTAVAAKDPTLAPFQTDYDTTRATFLQKFSLNAGENTALQAAQTAVTTAQTAYDTAEADARDAAEILLNAAKSTRDAAQITFNAGAIARTNAWATHRIANTALEAAKIEANRLIDEAQAALDAAILALAPFQAAVDALLPEPFEVASSLPNHSIQHVDITLKLLTPEGSKLARSIPVSDTLAERAAAFDAIAEQHSMTFTRRVNLIGGKLGSK